MLKFRLGGSRRRGAISPRAAVPGSEGSAVRVETLEPRRLMAVPAGFTESVFVSGVSKPTAMAFTPDGRLFVTQKDGNLRVVKNGSLLSTSFAKLSVQNSGERGLLGVAIDPNFASNKYVYVFYSRANGSGGYNNRVSRLTANGDVVAAGSEKVLIDGDVLNSDTGHNGGGLSFGKDGKLYIAIGDNHQGGAPLRTDNLFGKMLRINSDGSIPSDNPFYTRNSGKYRAVWAYGLRNPYSFAVQPGTGRIFINDVGQAKFEEINEGKAGANYGWPDSEGPTSNPAYKTPFYSYSHNGGEGAITGGAFYNPANASFGADYVGDYFFGDYVLNFIKRIDPATKAVSTFVTNTDLVIDVDVASDGSLYYLSREGEGRVYRVRRTTSSAPSIRVPPQDKTVPAGQPATFTVEAAGTGTLSYRWQRNGVNISGATGASYTVAEAGSSDNGARFRVIVSNTGGSVTSREAKLTVINDRPPTAAITQPGSGTLWTAGGQLSFAGTGTDPEDGTLPASAFTWRVDFHHDSHDHPFVDTYSGVRSDTVNLPSVGETDPDVYYRIHLTVRDSAGLEHSTFRDVQPRKVTLSLATQPAGLSLALDGQPVDTPHATSAVVGLRRTLGAPPTQVVGGVVYEFDAWSDGGAATHNVTTPAANVTYTARYKVATQQVASLRAVADAYVRDGSHANTNFGAAAQLQVKSGSAGWTRHGYLKFDLSSLGDGGVESATLRVRGQLDNDQVARVPVTVHAGQDNWSESGLTWNNKPASGSSALASFTVVGRTAQYYDIDLTAYLKQKKADGAAVATVVLKPGATAGATVLLATDEAAAAGERPQLLVRVGADPGPGTVPVTFRAGADAHVRDGSSAAANFGQASELEVKQSSLAGYTRETYLRFDVGTLQSVSSAKLRMHGQLTKAATVQATVFASSNTTWTESGITWDNRPATAGTALATVSVSGEAGRWIEWDLTAFLKAERAAGRGVITLVLKNLDAAAALVLNSDEATTSRPELVVTP